MGLFTYIRGRLRCVRCGTESSGVFQTYLFRTDADNSCREYGVGDSEVVDGLDEFYPLYPWDGRSPLVLGLGDWDCDRCSLNWQWARVVLDVSRSAATLVGTIRVVDTLAPWTPSALDLVHRVQGELAHISEFPGQVQGDWRAWLVRWEARPVADRSAAVASGFREWCRQVAGVSAPA
jgi:hypothetical protein